MADDADLERKVPLIWKVSHDIVTRLAEEIDSLKADPQVLRDAIVEIERLRAAGDALAEARSRHIVVTPDPLLAAWQEARRG